MWNVNKFRCRENSSPCSCVRPVTTFAQTKPKSLDYFLANWFLFFLELAPLMILYSPCIPHQSLAYIASFFLAIPPPFRQGSTTSNKTSRNAWLARGRVANKASNSWRVKGDSNFKVPVFPSTCDSETRGHLIACFSNGKTKEIYNSATTYCSKGDYALEVWMSLVGWLVDVAGQKWTDNNASFVAFHVLIPGSCQILIFFIRSLSWLCARLIQ